MGLFERFNLANYNSQEPDPMPENTNCINSYGEQSTWRLFTLHCHNHYHKIISWMKMERSFYKAISDDGRIIFFSTDVFDNTDYRIYNENQVKFENENDWSREFRARFRYLMQTRGFSQKELAQLTGLSESALSYYHRGMRMPTAYAVRRLASAFDCSPNFLMMYE